MSHPELPVLCERLNATGSGNVVSVCARDADNGAFSTSLCHYECPNRPVLSCNIFDPRCNEIPTKQMPSDNSDIFRIMYTPFGAFRHTINMLYDSVPVPGSPFFLNVKSGCDPLRCRNFGPELDKAWTNNLLPSRWILVVLKLVVFHRHSGRFV
ncbi:filamin-A [Culex quinquefasciatus]|uniref:filamin-A n=1 Tax=Culex quinquefasciatus TaxID=7176 RepID=UPI0018E30DFC|nr:filamin-A [Culex quinquefasciatus]XP_038107970.1 filamin-A [Culex quinquefasciatus]